MRTTWKEKEDIREHGLIYRLDGPPPADDEIIAHYEDGGIFRSCGFSAEQYSKMGIKRFLEENGNPPHRIVQENVRVFAPRGSGPMGRLRCGDDWNPSNFYVITKKA